MHEKSIAPDIAVIGLNLPIVYEDDGQEELGDSVLHYTSVATLYYGVQAHLADERQFCVLPNMDLHYHPLNQAAYVSPDVMVVEPTAEFRNPKEFYRIGLHGPSPPVAFEVLSERSVQQGDLTIKAELYAAIGVAEFILVDVTGGCLPERLQIRRLGPDRHWIIEQERDGGVTSSLGFRIEIEKDDELRVVDVATGHRCARPGEAEASKRD